MLIEQCQFEKEIFHWKTVLWHDNNIINVSSVMLHKYKQNITLNVIHTQIYAKKLTNHKETWGGSIFYGGEGQFYIIVL